MTNLINYIKKHGIQLVLLLIFVCLIYGQTAFSTNFYVDAEAVINNPGGVYNWNEIGRFGLIGLKFLIGGNWYNPYLEGVLFLLTYWILACLCVYLVSVLLKREDTVLSTIFAGLALFYPTYADQFMFRFQAFEIAFAMVLVIVNGLLFVRFIDIKKKSYALAIILLEVLSFGIYQSMVNLMIVVYALVYLFTVSVYEKKDRIYLIISSVILFVIGFTVYELIAKLFFSSGTYLSDSVGWTSGDIKTTVMNLLAYFKHVLLSQDVFYPYTFSLVVLLSVGTVICFVVTKKKKIGSYILGIFAMLASPFLLSILTGTPTAYRAQCMLPFSCAGLFVFCVNEFGNRLKAKDEKKYKIAMSVSAFVAVSLIIVQCSVILRLFYTQDTIRKNDEIVAIEIMSALNEYETAGVPIVFEGYLEPGINGSCYTKEQAQSFLAYSLYGFAYVDGVPVSDADYCNTHRILGYFESLGFEYTYPDVDVVNKVISENQDIESWPSKNSIVATEDYVLIRLSE